MEHYFINKEHSKSDYFTFFDTFNGKKYLFNSCKDVFSKNELDYGSLVLCNTIKTLDIKPQSRILDMCCGYGTIGILLASNYPDCIFTLADINKTGIELTNKNILENNLHNIDKVIESNMFDSVDGTFDYIVSNPPIKAGKNVLYKFLDGTISHLNLNGVLVIVVKKNLGADSVKKHLIELFGNCEVLNRDKGYYILKTVRRK